jgi:thiamine transporter 2/3
MYAVVDKRHFQKITSYVRTATLVGKFFAFSMAQILISTGFGTYTLLNQVIHIYHYQTNVSSFKITFGAVWLAFVISILIPLAPKQRFSDHRVSSAESLDRFDTNSLPIEEEIEQENEHQKSMKTRLKSLFMAFRNRTVLMWSVWWALASCGTYQVANYAQTLWGPM